MAGRRWGEGSLTVTTGADRDGRGTVHHRPSAIGHRPRGTPDGARAAEDVGGGPSPTGDRAGIGRSAVMDHHDPREKPQLMQEAAAVAAGTAAEVAGSEPVTPVGRPTEPAAAGVTEVNWLDWAAPGRAVPAATTGATTGAVSDAVAAPEGSEADLEPLTDKDDADVGPVVPDASGLEVAVGSGSSVGFGVAVAWSPLPIFSAKNARTAVGS
ncbi:hypothetical protein FAIPA1_20282 [Frankia sp. AiPs1]